jgi:hypothetical protein
MPINEWRGDAPAVAQRVQFIPPGVPARVDFRIGSRYLGLDVEWRRDDAGASTAAIVAAWQASQLAEFAEITAVATSTEIAGQVGSVPALNLTAKTAGFAFEVTAEIDGQAYTSEVQKIALVNSPTGGTWTITFSGQTTSGLAPGASAAAVQSALEALSNIASGDVTVTKANESWTNGVSYPVWTLRFGGTYASLNVPQVTVNSNSLTGGNLSVDVTPIMDGQVPLTEKQRLTAVGNATGGTFTVALPGLSAATIAYNSNASAAQTAFNSAWGAGRVTVTGGSLPGTPLDLEFVGDLANQDLPLVTVNASGLTGAASDLTVATTQAGSAGTSASYRYRLSSDPSVPDGSGRTAWNFVVYMNTPGADWISIPLSYTATAAQVRAAIEAMLLENVSVGSPQFVGPGNVTVTGSLNDSWSSPSNWMEITFGGTWHSCYINLAVGPSSSQVTGNNVNVSMQSQTVAAGSQGVNKVQTLTQTGTPSGNFRLSSGGQLTGPIPYGATALQVSVALARLTTLGVMGEPFGPYVVDYTSTAKTAQTPNPLSAYFAPNVVCTGGPLGTAPITLTYSGAGLHSSNSPAVTAIEGDVVAYEIRAGFAGVSERQRIVLRPGYLTAPYGGTWTITFDGQTTAGIAHSASASTVRGALDALSNLALGQVEVIGSSLASGFDVIFVPDLGNVPVMTAEGSALSNGLLYVRTDPQGGQRVEQRLLRESRGPWHCDDPLNWTLNHVPDSDEPLLLQFGATGPRFGITWLSTWTVSPADSTHLVCRNHLRTGQKVFVDSSGTLPTGVAANTAYYVNRVDVETIQLSATKGGAAISLTGGSGTHRVFVRCGGVKSLSSWTGWMGTPTINPEGRYREYRPIYWSMGYGSGARITIGEGNAGPGSQLTRLNFHDFNVVPEVISTAGSKETTLPACLLLGTHADLAIELVDGDLGVALLAGEISTIKRLTIRGGECSLGEGVTFPTGALVDKTGGELKSLAYIDGRMQLRG